VVEAGAEIGPACRIGPGKAVWAWRGNLFVRQIRLLACGFATRIEGVWQRWHLPRRFRVRLLEGFIINLRCLLPADRKAKAARNH